MENLLAWPINRYGTSWRRAFVYFDSQDEEIVDETIEAVDPLKITVRYHSAVIIGFNNIADMIMICLADKLPPHRQFDNDGMRALIDPCTDTVALRLVIEWYTDAFDFSVVGVGVLDLADQAAHEELLAALTDRRERFAGEVPCIEF